MYYIHLYDIELSIFKFYKPKCIEVTHIVLLASMSLEN